MKLKIAGICKGKNEKANTDFDKPISYPLVDVILSS